MNVLQIRNIYADRSIRHEWYKGIKPRGESIRGPGWIYRIQINVFSIYLRKWQDFKRGGGVVTLLSPEPGWVFYTTYPVNGRLYVTYWLNILVSRQLDNYVAPSFIFDVLRLVPTLVISWKCYSVNIRCRVAFPWWNAGTGTGLWGHPPPPGFHVTKR